MRKKKKRPQIDGKQIGVDSLDDSLNNKAITAGVISVFLEMPETTLLSAVNNSSVNGVQLKDGY